jgi:hypothetical protein
MSIHEMGSTALQSHAVVPWKRSRVSGGVDGLEFPPLSASSIDLTATELLGEGFSLVYDLPNIAATFSDSFVLHACEVRTIFLSRIVPSRVAPSLSQELLLPSFEVSLFISTSIAPSSISYRA